MVSNGKKYAIGRCSVTIVSCTSESAIIRSIVLLYIPTTTPMCIINTSIHTPSSVDNLLELPILVYIAKVARISGFRCHTPLLGFHQLPFLLCSASMITAKTFRACRYMFPPTWLFPMMNNLS